MFIDIYLWAGIGKNPGTDLELLLVLIGKDIAQGDQSETFPQQALRVPLTFALYLIDLGLVYLLS